VAARIGGPRTAARLGAVRSRRLTRRAGPVRAGRVEFGRTWLVTPNRAESGRIRPDRAKARPGGHRPRRKPKLRASTRFHGPQPRPAR